MSFGLAIFDMVSTSDCSRRRIGTGLRSIGCAKTIGDALVISTRYFA